MRLEKEEKKRWEGWRDEKVQKPIGEQWKHSYPREKGRGMEIFMRKKVWNLWGPGKCLWETLRALHNNVPLPISSKACPQEVEREPSFSLSCKGNGWEPGKEDHNNNNNQH